MLCAVWIEQIKKYFMRFKIEAEVRILLKKDTKQYQKRSLYSFPFANIIFNNVRYPIYVSRMTENHLPFLCLICSATVLVFWLNDRVCSALLIIWLPIPYQAKNSRAKVTQFDILCWVAKIKIRSLSP